MVGFIGDRAGFPCASCALCTCRRVRCIRSIILRRIRRTLYAPISGFRLIGISRILLRATRAAAKLLIIRSFPAAYSCPCAVRLIGHRAGLPAAIRILRSCRSRRIALRRSRCALHAPISGFRLIGISRILLRATRAAAKLLIIRSFPAAYSCPCAVRLIGHRAGLPAAIRILRSCRSRRIALRRSRCALHAPISGFRLDLIQIAGFLCAFRTSRRDTCLLVLRFFPFSRRHPLLVVIIDLCARLMDAIGVCRLRGRRYGRRLCRAIGLRLRRNSLFHAPIALLRLLRVLSDAVLPCRAFSVALYLRTVKRPFLRTVARHHRNGDLHHLPIANDDGFRQDAASLRV